MIGMTDVVKEFGELRALDGLNMTVPRGVVYGLVGPNGAGKTTALQHVAGVMRPTSGKVTVGGSLVFENPHVKEGIAYIPSDFYYYRQARISDMRRLHKSVYPRFDETRFHKLAQVFQMDVSANVRSLSKGMRKQLAFWLALSQRPDVLLLDEPLDGLDPAARRLVLGIVMDEVAQRHMTVVVSSHNLRELADVCDHVGFMESGRMRLERDLADLQEGLVKVQVAFESDEASLPSELDVVSSSAQGRLHTVVVRGDAEEVERILCEAGATFVNPLPLSLEEIFIYEVGGNCHADGILD